ncbi:MAG: hypothetical protein LBO21_01475 [Synergistaceae bacterium]|nr:hypothetical protein [Synergistaceae bacterium]
MYVVTKGGQVQGADGRTYRPGEPVPLHDGDVARLLRLGAILEIPDDEDTDGGEDESGADASEVTADDGGLSPAGGDIPESRDGETRDGVGGKPKGRRGK